MINGRKVNHSRDAEAKRRQIEGGRKGGLARMAKLSPEELRECGRHAADARWEKRRENHRWVMGYLKDREQYLTQEEFDALPGDESQDMASSGPTYNTYNPLAGPAQKWHHAPRKGYTF
jgi:hypothetical protein